MTIYEKRLVKIFEKRFGDYDVRKLMSKLVEIGVVDHTRCKILAIREYVENLVKEGSLKVDAMWIASEKFCCSYEYIRNCMYYYKDINID